MCGVCGRKLAQSSSVDAHGKDRDVSFAQKNDEVLLRIYDVYTDIHISL